MCLDRRTPFTWLFIKNTTQKKPTYEYYLLMISSAKPKRGQSICNPIFIWAKFCVENVFRIRIWCFFVAKIWVKTNVCGLIFCRVFVNNVSFLLLLTKSNHVFHFQYYLANFEMFTFVEIKYLQRYCWNKIEFIVTTWINEVISSRKVKYYKKWNRRQSRGSHTYWNKAFNS